MSKLILASGSPRRKDLLNEAGYDFRIEVSNADELDDPAIPIRELTAINAAIKGEPISEKFPDHIVLSADTLVLLGERVFAKPADKAEATEMLATLNGNTHQVFTAVCIVHAAEEKKVEFAVATEVTFRDLSKEEQANYHRMINPFDKAGAYAAQDHGEIIIESISGSMTNVIGLPMDEVSKTLDEVFNIRP